jgi:hypothetical protein
MPPKSTKNDTEFDQLKEELVKVSNELRVHIDKIGQLEKNRDEILTKLYNLMTPSTEEQSSVKKAPAKKGAVKKTEEVEPESDPEPEPVKKAPVKKGAVKKTEEPEVEATKKAPAKKGAAKEAEVESAKKAPTKKAPAKKGAAKEPEAEVESESLAPPKKKAAAPKKPVASQSVKAPEPIDDISSSDTDINSLSSCSSGSDDSGGEDD